MDISAHIRSLEHIRKQVPIALEKEWRESISLDNQKSREESIDKLANLRAKLDDFDVAVDQLIKKLHFVAS